MSANLCEALADIGGPQRNDFAFNFVWAALQPAPQPTPDIEFNERVIARLKEGGAHLQAIAPVQPASITGRVVELRRRPKGKVGSIVIEGSLVMGGQRQERTRVTVRLSANRYEMAV